MGKKKAISSPTAIRHGSDSCRTTDKQLSDSWRTAVRIAVGQLFVSRRTAVLLRRAFRIPTFRLQICRVGSAESLKKRSGKRAKEALLLHIYAKTGVSFEYLYSFVCFANWQNASIYSNRSNKSKGDAPKWRHLFFRHGWRGLTRIYISFLYPKVIIYLCNPRNPCLKKQKASFWNTLSFEPCYAP